jgi:putative transposase
MQSRRKSCRRFNDSAHAHALTFSCFQRQAFLSRDRARQWVVHAMRRALDQHAYHLWAYVLMPEHVHLLVWPMRPECRISLFLQSLKTSVARSAIAFVKKEAPWFLGRMVDQQPGGAVHYRFWQRGGGFDRNIFEVATLHREIDYIHANPVKRGLCSRPEDWTWSSAADYSRVRTGPLRIDFESLPPDVEVRSGKR